MEKFTVLRAVAAPMPRDNVDTDAIIPTPYVLRAIYSDYSEGLFAYWRYRDYAGIGPGAHGRVSVGEYLLATRRHRAPEVWAERVEREGHGTTAEEPVATADRAREMLLMGLRLAEGIDAERFAVRTGVPLDEAVDELKRRGILRSGWEMQ